MRAADDRHPSRRRGPVTRPGAELVQGVGAGKQHADRFGEGRNAVGVDRRVRGDDVGEAGGAQNAADARIDDAVFVIRDALVRRRRRMDVPVRPGVTGRPPVAR